MGLNDLKVLKRIETGALYLIRTKSIKYSINTPCVVKRLNGSTRGMLLIEGDVKLALIKDRPNPEYYGYELIPTTEEHLKIYAKGVVLDS